MLGRHRLSRLRGDRHGLRSRHPACSGRHLLCRGSPSDIVGCGGWSRRRTAFGSDKAPNKDDALLDPSVEPARIRAFFVHAAGARKGIGSRLMKVSESAARTAGFTRLELAATLAGEVLYRRHGLTAVEHFEVPLPNGATVPLIRMSKDLA
jgi:GNAT superfamily N-acetyltransferase